MKAAFKYFLLYWLFVIIGAMIFALPAIGVSELAGKSVADSYRDPWFFSVLFLGIDLVPLLFFWLLKYTRFDFKFNYDFGSSFSTRELYIWAGVGAIGCLFFDVVFGNYVTFPDWDTEGLEMLGDMASNPIGLLSICLLGPLVEETVFRGAIERRLLEKPWNPWYAIVISAIFFAVAHGNFSQGVTAMVIGCFLGWVYYRTRNIWPCVLIHALNNTTACAIGWALTGTEYEEATEFPHAVCIIMLVASIIMVYLAVKMIAQMTKDRTPLPAPVEVPPLPVEATLQPAGISVPDFQPTGTTEVTDTPLGTPIDDDPIIE